MSCNDWQRTLAKSASRIGVGAGEASQAGELVARSVTKPGSMNKSRLPTSHVSCVATFTRSRQS